MRLENSRERIIIRRMPGIQFVVDESGRKTAVVIDLKRHSRVWQDFYDRMIAEERAKEPRETIASVKKRLQRLGKLNA